MGKLVSSQSIAIVSIQLQHVLGEEECELLGWLL
mgnify:FL=1